MRAKLPQAIFGVRLREARTAAGLSQKKLGIAAGIDPSVASARINRYETGTHEPAIIVAMRLAEVLEVPLPYLYADDDRLAEVIVAFASLGRKAQYTFLRSLARRRKPNTAV
jgi:transcriptional regulator with XRE-family HTH domain